MDENAVLHSVLLPMSPYSNSCTFPRSCVLICTYCGTVLLSRQGKSCVRSLKGSGAVSCEISSVAALLLRYETRVEHDVWMSG